MCPPILDEGGRHSNPLQVGPESGKGTWTDQCRIDMHIRRPLFHLSNKLLQNLRPGFHRIVIIDFKMLIG